MQLPEWPHGNTALGYITTTTTTDNNNWFYIAPTQQLYELFALYRSTSVELQDPQLNGAAVGF